MLFDYHSDRVGLIVGHHCSIPCTLDLPLILSVL